MARLNINLPDDLRTKAELRAAESGHRNVEDYVQSLIVADADSATEDLGAPEQVIYESDDQLERALLERLEDPLIEATPEFWNDLRRQAQERSEGENK